MARHLGGEIEDTFTEVGAQIYSNVNQDPLDPDAFAFVVSGTEGNIFPMAGGAIEVNWGDREANARCGQAFSAGSPISCDYKLPGTYRISITGDMTAYGDASSLGKNDDVVRVVQWGNTGLTSLEYAFYGASRLIDVPSDLPSTTTNIWGLFWGASSLNDPDIASWDVSGVEDFTSLFEEASSFNVDIGGWDMSSALRLHHIFMYASSFNQDLSLWDVSNVHTLRGAFRGAAAFDQDLSSWDVSSVTTFRTMFQETNYNRDIEMWDVGSASSFAYMFSRNPSFNQDISGWDVSNAATFDSMFYLAEAFNQNISGWNVGSATNMHRMFRQASSFTHDLSSWCVTGIPVRPDYFSSDSSTSAEPIWGTCP